MAAFKSNYLANADLNWRRGILFPTPPADLYLALITTAPTDRAGTSLVEATGASYARQVIQDQLAAPATPVPTTATTGGTIAAGTYQVETTYVDLEGETIASGSGSVVTTGTTSTITVPSPASVSGATGWYAYVTQVGGATYTRQQTAGSPTAIGTALTLTAPPTSTGLNPPVSNTTANIGAPATVGSGVTSTQQVTSTAQISFVSMPAVTVVGAAVYDALTGGNFLDYADLTGGSQVVASGATFNFPLGNLTWSE